MGPRRRSRIQSFLREGPALVVLVLLLFLVRFSDIWQKQHVVLHDGAEVQIVRAIDGDTLLLEDDRRIRLLGVDTPETKHPTKPVEPFGPEASAFTSSLVNGKRVRLEFDRERYDDYQRILAYVYVDDVLLNEALIRAGLGYAKTNFPFRADMKKRFVIAESEAQAAVRGVWSLPEHAPAPDALKTQ